MVQTRTSAQNTAEATEHGGSDLTLKNPRPLATEQRTPHKPQNRPKKSARHRNPPTARYRRNTLKIPMKYPQNAIFLLGGVFRGVSEGVFRGIWRLVCWLFFCMSWAFLFCSWSRGCQDLTLKTLGIAPCPFRGALCVSWRPGGTTKECCEFLMAKSCYPLVLVLDF